MQRRPRTRSLIRHLVVFSILVLAWGPGLTAAGAQEVSTSGEVEVAVGDGLASGDSTLSSLAGVKPDAQIISGGVKLHLNQRLSYKNSELYLDDTLSLYQGSGGSVLANRLVQGYVAVTPIPELTLVVGKRRLPWGYGYAFAPGDRINPASSPQDSSEGFYGVDATLSPSASFTFTGAVRLDTAFPQLDSLSGFTPSGTATGAATGGASALPFLSPYLPSTPANPWARLRYAVYADSLFGNLDTYAAVTYQWERLFRPTVGFSLDLGGIIANGAVAVELSNTGLYPTGSSPGSGYAIPAAGKAYPLFTFGLQRSIQTDSGSFAMTAEYLYDGTGYDSSQAKVFYGDLLAALASVPPGTYTPADYVAGGGAWLSSGEGIPRLGRSYGAVSLAGSITRVFSATVAGLVNLGDGSFALQPEIRFTRFSGVDLFTRAVIGWGKNKESEFGLLPTPLTISAGVIAHF